MSTTPQAARGALRIGAVAGVPVYLERTWLLLAAFIGWTGWQAGNGVSTGFGIAYAAWLVVAIFVAIIGHEVGHAVSARLLGFRVHRIVATLWGGHTAYDGTGATPGRSAVVALSGPLVNVGFALVGWVAAVTLDYPASDFAWAFAFVNGLLAVFNLLPGLPLDGGAALQSLVWGVSGRRDLGLVVAGWVGRLLALGLLGWFLVLPLLRSQRPDLVDALIGLVMAWVLWSGASAAIRRAPVEKLVGAVRMREVAQPAVVLPTSTTLAEVAAGTHLVTCLDESGLPTLVLTGEAAAGAAPSTALGAVVVRIPDGNVVEASPEDDISRVLAAFGSGTPLVVLTHQGQVWGGTSVAAVNAAAQRVQARN